MGFQGSEHQKSGRFRRNKRVSEAANDGSLSFERLSEEARLESVTLPGYKR